MLLRKLKLLQTTRKSLEIIDLASPWCDTGEEISRTSRASDGVVFTAVRPIEMRRALQS